MSNLYITEYTGLALNGQAPIPQEPALANQKVSVTGTPGQSAAFNIRTTFVRIVADADASVLFSTNPTAAATDQFVSAEVEYWRGVKEGGTLKVSAIANP